MARFDSAAALALKLIAKNGGPTTLRTYLQGPSSNPTTPWKPTGASPVDYPDIKCCFFSYTDQGRAPKVFADGSFARTGDQEVYMAASGLEVDPDLNSVLIREDGSQWTVKAVDLLAPNGQKIVFVLWVTQ